MRRKTKQTSGIDRVPAFPIDKSLRVPTIPICDTSFLNQILPILMKGNALLMSPWPTDIFLTKAACGSWWPGRLMDKSGAPRINAWEWPERS